MTRVVAAPRGPQRPQAVHTGGLKILGRPPGVASVSPGSPRGSAGVPGDPQGIPGRTPGCFQGIPWGPWEGPRASRSGHIKRPNTYMVPRGHMCTSTSVMSISTPTIEMENRTTAPRRPGRSQVVHAGVPRALAGPIRPACGS